MISLARLFAGLDSNQGLVAFGREGARTHAELRRDVGACAAWLRAIGARRVVLHCEDAYAFAVGLLGATHAGARAVLPPSRQPGVLSALAGDVDAFLLDGACDADALGARVCGHPLDAPASDIELEGLDRDAPLVELFTSGTTGAGKPVSKSLRHLDDEVAMLEKQLGPLLGEDASVLATTAPQHLYGLLFRVLWPLCAGRPFLRTSVLHAEELAPYFDAASAFALVTTPIALRHLCEKRHPGAHAAACRAVFCSGGALAASVARRARVVFGSAPMELLGSTETGGVALRVQPRDEAWRPLPGVTVSADADGCLAVTSPFVSVGDARADGSARFVLGDRVEFERDGRFRLLGRADRVLKIGDKRIALPVLEERIGRHPAVAEAAVVGLEQPGAETRIGAVIVPSETGREIVAAGGRRALAKALAEHLSREFDRVLLPRAWRLVEALPRNAQGKIPWSELQQMFAEEEAPLAQGEPGRREAETIFEIEPDLSFLAGHFPSFPIVAGVAQVHFAMRALAELIGEMPRLASLEALKFHETLRPGARVRMRVGVDAAASRFDFVLADAARPDVVFSRGRGTLLDTP